MGKGWEMLRRAVIRVEYLSDPSLSLHWETSRWQPIWRTYGTSECLGHTSNKIRQSFIWTSTISLFTSKPAAWALMCLPVAFSNHAHFLGLVSRTRVGEGCLEVCHEIRTTASTLPFIHFSSARFYIWVATLGPLLLIGKLRRESISPELCRAETLQDEMQELESEGLCKCVALVSFIRQGSCLLFLRGSDLSWGTMRGTCQGKGQLGL